MKKDKIVYVEPADYFPKSIRKKYKLGEFSEIVKAPAKKCVRKSKESV